MLAFSRQQPSEPQLVSAKFWFGPQDLANQDSDGKDGVTHTQTIESFFAILKRGINGSFHSVSEQHLQRYVDEFAFRWNTRSSLGVEDFERASLVLKGAAGKRLTYRPPHKALHE